MFIFAVGLIGCSDDASGKNGSGGGDNELTIAYDSNPPTLDPHMSTATATFDFATQIYEPLFAIDSNYEPQPMLAESYEKSDDGKTITIKLREGIKFHNGEEMTAEDVVASMERWVEQSAVGSANLSGATFEADGDYDVILTLDEPNPLVLNTLATPQQFAAIIPKDVIENAGVDGITEYIGTGPFEVEEWEDSQHLYLKKFDDYSSVSEPSDGLSGEKDVSVDSVKIEIVTDETIRFSGLQTDEYDIGMRIPYDNAEDLEADGSLKSFAEPFGFQGIWFNKKDSPMAEKKMRKAINAALDMDAVSTAAYTDEKYYDASHSLVSEDQELWYSDAGSDQYNQKDPEKAKKLLDEIGYDGEEITFMTTREYPEHYQAAVTIQSQLEELGMNITLQEYDWATLLEKREEKDGWDILTSGFNFEPFPADAIYLHSKNEYAGWNDSDEIDRLVEEIKQSETTDEAAELFDELQEEVWDYLPFIPFGHHKPLHGMQDNIDGFDVNYSMVLWNLKKE